MNQTVARFGAIVLQARCEAAATWDDEAIRRALQWAGLVSKVCCGRGNDFEVSNFKALENKFPNRN